MADYDESLNFNHRLKVETTFAPGDVRDHREGFTQREYTRNQQDKNKTDKEPEPKAGFPPMESVTKAPRKKTKKDLELEAANKKDLQNRNLKNS